MHRQELHQLHNPILCGSEAHGQFFTFTLNNFKKLFSICSVHSQVPSHGILKYLIDNEVGFFRSLGGNGPTEQKHGKHSFLDHGCLDINEGGMVGMHLCAVEISRSAFARLIPEPVRIVEPLHFGQH